jgi:sortase (surface protein transpeptidase)
MFFWSLITLAIIGVVSQLVESPSAFFNSIINIILFTGLILLVFLGFRKLFSSTESNKYTSAVKASKNKYKDNDSIFSKLRKKTVKNTDFLKKTSFNSVMKKKRDSSHLKLIEGKKNKKKAN